MNSGFSSHSLLNRYVFDIEKQGLVATENIKRKQISFQTAPPFKKIYGRWKSDKFTNFMFRNTTLFVCIWVFGGSSSSHSTKYGIFFGDFQLKERKANGRRSNMKAK